MHFRSQLKVGSAFLASIEIQPTNGALLSERGTRGFDPCRQCPRDAAVDFGPEEFGCLINQLGNQSLQKNPMKSRLQAFYGRAGVIKQEKTCSKHQQKSKVKQKIWQEVKDDSHGN